MNKKDIYIAFKMFESIARPFDINKINTYVFANYKDNMHYSKIKNTHLIYNYYIDRQTKCITHKTHLLVESNENIPSFLTCLKRIKGLFVCDFNNKDYFWLHDI